MRLCEIVAESILTELQPVAARNIHQEVGAGGHTIESRPRDALPHNSIPERNHPKSLPDIAIKAEGDTHNDDFTREPPPSNEQWQRRRNNDAGFRKLTPVSDKGNASALLHKDFAGGPAKTRAIIPKK